MTTWADNDQNPGVTLNRPGCLFEDPDTITLEEYRRWQTQTLFDTLPCRLAPETIRLRGEWL